ncbi:MAG: DUF3179 domain-containing protein [Sedimenticola sp.]|nr:DUF3179 domain-containing protein [Sedimenticola sp.]
MNRYSKSIRYLPVLMLWLPLISAAVTVGDFTLDPTRTLVPVDEIHSGGPPRDGIPSIDRPRFLEVDEKGIPEAGDPVLGLVRDGEAKAYPIAIMNWHEIVNDRIAGEPVVITYCPLCGSGVAFSARVEGNTLEFGVSGLLYNSDVLLYDRKTESLWSQLLARAISGQMRGSELKVLPMMVTSWEEWQRLYPDTRVLSRETGYQRDYDRDPYAGYQDSEGVYFPVSRRDPRFHPKELVYGLEIAGQFKAYPVSRLSMAGPGAADRFAGEHLDLRFNPSTGSLRILDRQGNELPVIRSFWFAWYAFHPETEVYHP